MSRRIAHIHHPLYTLHQRPRHLNHSRHIVNPSTLRPVSTASGTSLLPSRLHRRQDGPRQFPPRHEHPSLYSTRAQLRTRLKRRGAVSCTIDGTIQTENLRQDGSGKTLILTLFPRRCAEDRPPDVAVSRDGVGYWTRRETREAKCLDNLVPRVPESKTPTARLSCEMALQGGRPGNTTRLVVFLGE